MAHHIFWPVDMPEPDLVRHVRVRIPFDWGFSKNAMWSVARAGHVFVREEQRMLLGALGERIRAYDPKPWPQRKTWLDILVQKPSHKGDAVNVIDLVCDGVKRAIGVDDRWFALRRVEWEIVKGAPYLFVGIGQDGTTNQQACSFCGRVLELDTFTKSRGNRLGVSRECKDCSRAVDRERRPRAGALVSVGLGQHPLEEIGL